MTSHSIMVGLTVHLKFANLYLVVQAYMFLDDPSNSLFWYFTSL